MIAFGTHRIGGSCLRRQRSGLLIGAPVAALVSGSAGSGAAPVTDYIVVNPITVCSNTGTGCAPFNTLSRAPNPATATATTPIGFVDATTNVNVTRAIWLESGIDLTFLPI